MFIPFIFAPVLNAIIAYTAVHMGMVGMAVSQTAWTAPALLGASWGAGWTLSPVLLVVALLIMDIFIYLPFFKMFEKQLLEEESKVEKANEATATPEGEGVAA